MMKFSIKKKNVEKTKLHVAITHLKLFYNIVEINDILFISTL